jgi:peptide deformylase
VIKKILIWPHPDLKKKSAPVLPEEFGTAAFNNLILDMWETLYDVGGVGLSAIQIGVPKRVFIVDAGKSSSRKAPVRWVFINPVLSLKEETAPLNEGCLSLPGIVETVVRHTAVSVEAVDETGEAFAGDFVGLEGQCIQHEHDHLDGIAIPDRVDQEAYAKILKKLKAKS